MTDRAYYWSEQGEPLTEAAKEIGSIDVSKIPSHIKTDDDLAAYILADEIEGHAV